MRRFQWLPGRVGQSVRDKIRLGIVAAAGVTVQAALAAESIGSSGSSTFAKLTSWFQDFVDFMDGPFGLAVVIVSLILAFAAWAFSPREGIVGPLLRVLVSAIVILNMGTWITSFRS